MSYIQHESKGVKGNVGMSSSLFLDHAVITKKHQRALESWCKWEMMLGFQRGLNDFLAGRTTPKDGITKEAGKCLNAKCLDKKVIINSRLIYKLIWVQQALSINFHNQEMLWWLDMCYCQSPSTMVVMLHSPYHIAAAHPTTSSKYIFQKINTQFQLTYIHHIFWKSGMSDGSLKLDWC